MINSLFGTKKTQDVDQVMGEFLTWMGQQGFSGLKERSHRGEAGRWMVKFHHITPSAFDPTKAIMVYRGWLHAKPGKIQLHIERVPAKAVDPNALPDTAAIVNWRRSYRLGDLDSLKPLKDEVLRWKP